MSKVSEQDVHSNGRHIPENVIAFGDNAKDMGLFAYVGRYASVGNAIDEANAAAYIAFENCVAKANNVFIRGEEKTC